MRNDYQKENPSVQYKLNELRVAGAFLVFFLLVFFLSLGLLYYCGWLGKTVGVLLFLVCVPLVIHFSYLTYERNSMYLFVLRSHRYPPSPPVSIDGGWPDPGNESCERCGHDTVPPSPGGYNSPPSGTCSNCGHGYGNRGGYG